MGEIEDAQRRVASSLDEVRHALTNAGLQTVDAPPFVMGAGVGVAWSETFYAMLSIGQFLDQQLNITYGLMQNITQDRLRALEFCNRHNQNLTAYPVYLHDAEIGWDLLQQNVLPMQVLRDAPEFVTGFYLGGQSEIVDELRSKAGEAELGGAPYRWNTDDVARLLARSLL